MEENDPEGILELIVPRIQYKFDEAIKIDESIDQNLVV
jgi:hypothetical protein